MIILRTTAHAKLNLMLDVIGKRPDGYHDLEMVMQEITLGDDLTLTLGTGKTWSVVSESGEIPCDDTNLAIKAARLFFEASSLDCGGLTVEIRKHTPVCAGMGGGSADGAAVLRLLYEYYNRPISEKKLYEIAEQVGSDVPFALFGGTALAREKGQILRPVAPMPECYIVICKPPFPVSTPALFRAIDAEEISERPDTAAMLQALENGSITDVASMLKNVFTPVIAREHTEICEIRETMSLCGAAGTEMTGSGPTVYGIFTDKFSAEKAFECLRSKYIDTFIAEPV